MFQTEREVVKEERRMRVENQPYGRLNEIVYDQAFTVHPYKHPTIGSMKDLEAASIEDVREFFRPTTCRTTPPWSWLGTSTPRKRQRWCNSISRAFPKSARPCRVTFRRSRRR